MKRLTLLATATLFLAACQSSAPVVQPPASQTALTAPLNSAPVLDYVSHNGAQVPGYTSPMLNTSKFVPAGKIKIQGSTVTLEIQLPPLPNQAKQNFKTQALDLSAATKILATVSDSLGKSYQPVGADGGGLVNYPPSGVVSLTFNNVLPDSLLFVELQSRDAGGDIPQANLAAVFSNTTTSNTNTTLDFQTTPTAKAMKALLGANATRARAINLADLNTLMTSITGYSAGPPIAYTTHPSLVNTALLATDLAGTDPGSLTPANYALTGATVSADVVGLVGSDKINLQVTDAASAVKTDVSNGTGILIPKAAPGTGLKVLVGGVASNSAQYTFAITPSATVNLTNGNTSSVTITATPAAISLSTLTPNAGSISSSVTIAGTGFSTDMANNIVKFGATTATVTAASTTSLTVTVPGGIFGATPVTVQVGATTSNSLNYQVRPTITAVSPVTGSTGDIITITGTGFDGATMSNNTVSFGSGTGTVTAATPTSLTVTVNEAPAGTANASVTVGAQTSTTSAFAIKPRLTSLTTAEAVTGKAVLVRLRTLTIAGTNFDPNPANNSVAFTLTNSTVVNATPTAATATSLTIPVPAGVDVVGDVGVVVTTHAQASNSLTGIVSTMAVNVSNGGFH